MKTSRAIRYSAITLLLLLLCIALGSFVYQWSISRVKSSAINLAGYKPYCIQIPGKVGYKEARSIGDLSLFRMRAAHGNHHAVLVLRNEATSDHFHWSYWRGEFVQGAIGPLAAYCNPRQDFVAVIKSSQLPEPASFKFSIDGMKFSVPFSFRPTVTGSNARSGITFFASAPSFGPLNNPPDYNKAVSASDILSHIEVNFGKTGRPTVWLDKSSSTYKVEDAGNEFGLEKQFKWYLPSNSTAAVQYSAKNKSEEVTTVIHCPGGNVGSCLHTFEKNGWTYTFHQREAEIPEWESMQERLVSVTNSFITLDESIR
jgi:hypothetical protein